MERAEAVDVLKEISGACKDFDGTSVSLIEPQVQSGESIGYMIQIRKQLDTQEVNCIKPILEKHNLNIKQDAGTVLIYKPTL